MTSIEDHAERGGGPEIVLTPDLPQRGRAEIQDTDLIDHDEVTDEGQFPEHGKFLEMTTEDDETEYWECAGGLATALMELAEEEELKGQVFQVRSVSKTPSGEWRFQLELFGG